MAPEQRKEIIDSYQKGMSAKDISAIVGTSEVAIYSILRNEGIPRHNTRKAYTEETRIRAMRMAIINGCTCEFISEELDIPYYTILDWRQAFKRPISELDRKVVATITDLEPKRINAVPKIEVKEERKAEMLTTDQIADGIETLVLRDKKLKEENEKLTKRNAYLEEKLKDYLGQQNRKVALTIEALNRDNALGQATLNGR